MFSYILDQLEKELDILKNIDNPHEPNNTEVKLVAGRIFLLSQKFSKYCGNTIDCDLALTEFKSLLSDVPIVNIRGQDFTYLEMSSGLQWYILIDGKTEKIDYNPILEK